MIDYSKIPESTMETLEAWIESARPTGGFVYAVLSNNLYEAMGRADESNRAALYEICCWLQNRAPIGCWGSPESVAAWTEFKKAERRRNSHVAEPFRGLINEFTGGDAA